VLVIDDERDLVELVRYSLEREGFRVLGAADGEAGVALALERRPDLIVLDRMMPGPDGVQVCRRLRQEPLTADIPVILLTARAAEAERVEGLEAGADDYVTKPFSPKELAARVRARLRRPAAAPELPSLVRNGDLVIDEARREVTYGGRPVPLAASEFRILQFLAGCPGRVMFRRSSPPGELLLGALAVRQRLVFPKQLREVLAAQDRNPTRKIGELLVERFFLAPKDLDRLLERQAQAIGGADGVSGLLGRLLVERGMATDFQVNEALRLQGKLLEAGLKPVPRLGEILVRRGALSRDALPAALQLQNFMLYRCPACSARVPLQAGAEGGPARCPACGAEIPALFERLASAIHGVLEETVREHAVVLPDEVLEAAADPKRQFGRYLLVSVLGKGGAGEVYRAWDRDANREVALKVLSREGLSEGGKRTPFGDPQAVRRFFHEARAVAELDHPNIVRLLDYGIAEGCYYCVLPLIEGTTFEKLIHGGARDREPGRDLPRRLVLSIVRDIARALDYAHAKGVCHRDVKPANILVDSRAKAWLIDFGLARVEAIGDEGWERGTVYGTPYYMPPEQVTGPMERVDARSDVYSLGAVLYEALSGRWPYQEKPTEAAWAAVLAQPPSPIRALTPDLDEALAAIIERAMARDPDARFARAGDLADGLQTCIDRLPEAAGAAHV
jgi:DNA-binding response OmpR family regulator/DNA-directed RNA polymerase subunit RPC12/RpoP